MRRNSDVETRQDVPDGEGRGGPPRERGAGSDRGGAARREPIGTRNMAMYVCV